MRTCLDRIRRYYFLRHFSKRLGGVFASTAMMLAWCSPSVAHEFWILPSAFQATSGTPQRLALYVGEYFEGDVVPFSRQYVTAFRHYSSAGVKDVMPSVPAADQGAMPLAFKHAGTQMLAIDTHPNQVTLSADRFHAYLHEEGLDSIIQKREAAGVATKPGRERYRRYIKTLLRVDGQSDDTALLRTGQRMEIVPLADPYKQSPGSTMRFKLLFENKPLAGVLVKASHKHNEQTVVIRTRADEEGVARFTLPFAGTWMVSSVHMIPAKGVPNIDWDSFWGNLTFELPSSAK